MFGLIAALASSADRGIAYGQGRHAELLISQPIDSAEQGRAGGALETAAAILLVDGSRIAANRWRFDSKTCEVSNEWGQMEIPLAAVQAIVWNGPLDREAWQRIERKAARLKGPEDAVIAIDGTVTRGSLVAGQTIESQDRQGEFRLAGAEQSSEARPTIDFSGPRLRAFVSSPALRMATVVDDQDHWMALSDGSLVRLKSPLQESPKRLAVGGEFLQVGGMSNRWDAMLVWSAPAVQSGALELRSPLRYRHVPSFGDVIAMDSWGDSSSPRWCEGEWVRSGIEVPANSRIVYRLNGEQRLRGFVRARMDVAPNHDRLLRSMVCRFIVQTADASGKLTTRWQSPEITAGTEGNLSESEEETDRTAEIDIDLAGAKLLILGVDPIGNAGFGRGQWLEMTLGQ
ncbi:hypothetical protein FF011L_47470 [Roseimaritima multifibrata]|uniref:NPCBM/NEW2 domain protein n=2 Tax=Roseimaritima multifibrata TaxID=1930274 RepID=A0A517MM24_9BACT|nr:hypothetical protein FF011L_47470 [Roseimaritima multifibrata]